MRHGRLRIERGGQIKALCVARTKWPLRARTAKLPESQNQGTAEMVSIEHYLDLGTIALRARQRYFDYFAFSAVAESDGDVPAQIERDRLTVFAFDVRQLSQQGQHFIDVPIVEQHVVRIA